MLSEHDISRIAIAVKSIMLSEIDLLVQRKVDDRYRTIMDCCEQLATQNKILQNRIDDLEMYSRRSCVRIFGVPENNFEKANTDEAILAIAERIEVPLKASDIAVSHRVGKVPKEDPEDPKDPKDSKPKKPRPIIARITNYELRHRLIKESRQLPKIKDIRDDMKGVFVNQDLTKARSKLAYEARQIVKSEKAKASFVWDGKIFIVDNKEKETSHHVLRRSTRTQSYTRSLHRRFDHDGPALDQRMFNGWAILLRLQVWHL